MICSTLVLRARYLEKNMTFASALGNELTPRIDSGDPSAGIKARTMVTTALGCFALALTRWALDGVQEPLGALVAQMLGYVHVPASAGD